MYSNQNQFTRASQPSIPIANNIQTLLPYLESFFQHKIKDYDTRDLLVFLREQFKCADIQPTPTNQDNYLDFLIGNVSSIRKPSVVINDLNNYAKLLTKDQFRAVVSHGLALDITHETVSSGALHNWYLLTYFYAGGVDTIDQSNVELMTAVQRREFFNKLAELRIQEILRHENYPYFHDPLYNFLTRTELIENKYLKTTLVDTIVNACIENPFSDTSYKMLRWGLLKLFSDRLSDYILTIEKSEDTELIGLLLLNPELHQTASNEQINRLVDKVLVGYPDSLNTGLEKLLTHMPFEGDEDQSDNSLTILQVLGANKLVELACIAPQSEFTRMLFAREDIHRIFLGHEESYKKIIRVNNTPLKSARQPTASNRALKEKTTLPAESLKKLLENPNDIEAYRLLVAQPSILKNLDAELARQVAEVICMHHASCLTKLILNYSAPTRLDPDEQYICHIENFPSDSLKLIYQSARDSQDPLLANYFLYHPICREVCTQEELRELTDKAVSFFILERTAPFLHWQREFGIVRNQSMQSIAEGSNLMSGIDNMLEVYNFSETNSKDLAIRILSGERPPGPPAPNLYLAAEFLSQPDFRKLLSDEQQKLLAETILKVWQAPRISFLDSFFEKLEENGDFAVIFGELAFDALKHALLNPSNSTAEIAQNLFHGNLKSFSKTQYVKDFLIEEIRRDPNSDFVAALSRVKQLRNYLGSNFGSYVNIALENPNSQFAWQLLFHKNILDDLGFVRQLCFAKLDKLPSEAVGELLNCVNTLIDRFESDKSRAEQLSLEFWRGAPPYIKIAH